MARCNLNCSYCYIYNHEDTSYLRRPRFISDEVVHAAIGRMRDYCERRPGHAMSLVFHGGEPTLMPPARFDRIAGYVRDEFGSALAGMSIQTNATLIDDRWIDIFSRHGLSVGVSLDGPREVHDAVRVDHANRGSYDATMAGIRRLQGAGIEPRILCVINPGSSGLDVYRHFRDEGIRWMSFLLPDVSHDHKRDWYGGFEPTPVARYLIPIFDEWFRADEPEIVIANFWDLLRRLMGGPGLVDCFGNPLMSYLVVETDGSIEALDALRVCDEGIANSGLNVLDHGFDDLASGARLVHQAVHEGFPLCAKCLQCEFVDVCGGGYLPHRYSRARSFDNPSVWCEDILILLRHMEASIREFAPA
ncbi:MAG: radical SAM protein [Actinomycetota bacterium]|nr:radical SAM protein [Actinomycetota bacterium]